MNLRLGEKLKKTLDELEQAKIQRAEDKSRSNTIKIRRERQELENFLSNIRETFVYKINEGRVPLKKIENFNRQSWLKRAVKGDAEHQDLWNDFCQYWRSEGLEPKVSDDHDGMGMKSWVNLTVELRDNHD